jgi:hypothetical protein
MFTTAITVLAAAYMYVNGAPNGDVEVGFGAPLTVDLAITYLVGVHVGAFPLP